MRRLLFNPILILLLPHAYIAWRIIPALGPGALGQFAVACCLVASCVLIPLAMTARSMRNRILADRLAWVGFFAMGLFSSLLVLTLLRDVLLLGTFLSMSAQTIGSLRSASAWAALVLSVLASLAGLSISRRVARVVEVEVPVTDLPKALHGFSIAQISDVHVGPTIKRPMVDAIVKRVNALDADLIALTGDLVDGTVRQLAAHTAPFAQLSARHGAFFVTGNHEYYSGEADWTGEFRRLGLKVLKNEHVVLEHDGASLVIAGVTDYHADRFDPAQRSDPSAALTGAPVDAGAKILLAHQPASAFAAAAAGYDVQLSGHTHGGQFWPWNLFVRFFQPFTAGLSRLQDLMVYVNRGTGYWGPPTRLGVPPEITRVRLVRAGQTKTTRRH